MILEKKREGEGKMQLNKKKFQLSQHSSRQVFFRKASKGDIETLKNHWTVYLRAQCISISPTTILYYSLMAWNIIFCMNYYES